MSKELSQRLDACAADIINGEIQYSDKVVGLLMEAAETLSHLPDREEVARVIEPEAFVERDRLYRLAQVNAGFSHEDATTYANSYVGISKRLTTALAKADRILSLMERKA